MKQIAKELFVTLPLLLTVACTTTTQSERDAVKKIQQLEELVAEAKSSGFDTSREECTLWMSETFLTYADWDDDNFEINLKQFASWPTFKDVAEEMVLELPEFERSEINKMLDASILELKSVMRGDIVRRDVPKIDWSSITPEGNQFVSNGRPVYINDYFTKTAGHDNDYCGSTLSASMSLNNLEGDGSLSESGERLKNTPESYSGYVLLWHGTPPSWAMDKYEGLTDGSRNFIKYDIDNPHIREIWSDAFERLVPYTKGKPITDMGYILSNEPHWFTVENTWATGDLSHYTKSKFKAWLKNKHKSIDTLNKLWGSNYTDFDSIDFKLPFSRSLLGTAAGYDWMTFNMARVNEWFAFLQSEIKRLDPEARTHVKIMPHLFSEDKRDHGIDLETITDMSDIIGNDAKLTRKQTFIQDEEYWEGVYSYDWKEVAFNYDFMKSVAPQKPNVNSESHYLSSSRYRDLYMTPEFVRSTYWLSLVHGMNVSFSWFWAREKDGSIRKDLISYKGTDNAMGNSYAASVVHQPRVANEVTQTFMDANAFSYEMAAFQSLRKPVRIFYSNTSVMNKTHHMESLFELYRGQYFDGTPLGFVTEGILNRGDDSLWDVVMVKESEYVTDSEFAALQEYLNRGGVVIIDKGSLTNNEYRKPRKAKLSASNGVLIDATNNEEFITASKRILKDKGELPAISIEESNAVNEKGCFWRVIPSTDGDGYILTIINLGVGDAKLTLSKRDGRVGSIEDIMTGRAIENGITLPSDEVLLIKVHSL